MKRLPLGDWLVLRYHAHIGDLFPSLEKTNQVATMPTEQRHQEEKVLTETPKVIKFSVNSGLGASIMLIILINI